MIPYLVLLFIVISWIFLFKRNTNIDEVILPIVLLMLLYSVRDINIGSDTPSYVSKFINNFDYLYYRFDSNVEIGYQLLEYSILKFTNNHFWFFVLMSLFVIPCYILTIKRISVDYLTSVFIFICFGFYTFFFNGLRQGIAMAICFFGLNYLLKNKISAYFLIVSIASIFHISAIIMIFLYLLVRIRIKLHFKIIISFLISIISSQFLINYLAVDNSRYQNYTEISENSGGYLTLIFFLLIGLVIYFYGFQLRVKILFFNKFEQVYLCGLALVVPIAMLGTDPSGPQRIMYYFLSVLIFLIPYLLKKANNIYIYIVFYFMSLIYFVLITMRFSHLYPYRINPVFGVF